MLEPISIQRLISFWVKSEFRSLVSKLVRVGSSGRFFSKLWGSLPLFVNSTASLLATSIGSWM